MTAEELRIGNYVLDEENKVRLVTELSRALIRTSFDLILLASEVKPIPLTEEILLKCGFEINGKYYRSKYIQDSIKLIYYFNQRVLYFKYKGEFSPMIQIPRAIESLHELQNIYYALTGEELEAHL